MMRNLLLSVVLLAPFVAFTQTLGERNAKNGTTEGFFGLSLSAGVLLNNAHVRDLRMLTDTWNGYMADQGLLVKGLSYLPTHGGYFFNGQVRVLGGMVGLEYGAGTARATGQTLYGTREFELRYRTTTVDVGLGIPHRLAFMMSVVNNRSVLYSGFRTHSGHLSYGTESYLNGVYQFSPSGNGYPDIGLGIMVATKPKKRISATLRADYIGLLERKVRYGTYLKLDDHTGGGIYIQDDLPAYLPRDYNDIDNRSAIHSGNAQTGVDFVRPNSRGFRLRLGITIDLLKPFEND